MPIDEPAEASMTVQIQDRLSQYGLAPLHLHLPGIRLYTCTSDELEMAA